MLSAVFFGVVGAQIRVLSPKALLEKFAATKGNIVGTTAVFGTPYYGDRVLGRLVYGESAGQAHCTDEDYHAPLAAANGYQNHDQGDYNYQGQSSGTASRQQRARNIFVVRRGMCTFVSKVKVAERKGADAVIIVDKADSKKTPEEIQNIIVADDGYGVNVRIPSILITSKEGQHLIDAALNRYEDVMVELAWDLPTAHVVRFDLWVHPGGSDFLDDFKETALTLKWDLDFVPHWYVFPLPQDFNSQCTDASTKYCMEDPDGPGPITGKMVAEEALRLWCIREVYGQRDPMNEHNPAIFSPIWWEYAQKFHKECKLDGLTEATRFGPTCATAVGRKVSVNEDLVADCVKKDTDSILEAQVRNHAWSPTALRINGWRYSGPHEAPVVAKAICSGYVVRPAACEKIALAHTPGVDNEIVEGGASAWSLVGSVMFALGLLLTGLHCHRRNMLNEVRSLYQLDVRSEVKSSMSAYSQLRG
jgi:hypothetical protein